MSCIYFKYFCIIKSNTFFFYIYLLTECLQSSWLHEPVALRHMCKSLRSPIGHCNASLERYAFVISIRECLIHIESPLSLRQTCSQHVASLPVPLLGPSLGPVINYNMKTFSSNKNGRSLRWQRPFTTCLEQYLWRS